jgi:hypothetical protein
MVWNSGDMQRNTQDAMWRALRQIQFNQDFQAAMAQSRARQKQINKMSRRHHPVHALAHAAVTLWPVVKVVTPLVVASMQKSRDVKQSQRPPGT